MKMTVESDFDGYSEFVRLEKRLGQTMADSIFLRLWKELSYHAASSPLGCLPKEDFQFFYQRLKLATPTEAEMADLLCSIKLLKDHDEYFFCKPFFMANQDLVIRPSYVSATQILFMNRLKAHCEKIGEKDSNEMPPEYNIVDDVPMHDLERNRVMVLIRILDGIFTVKQRKKSEIGIGLVHDACRAVRRFGPQKMQIILDRICAQKNKMSSRSAEMILSDFDRILAELEPIDGWGVLEKYLSK